MTSPFADLTFTPDEGYRQMTGIAVATATIPPGLPADATVAQVLQYGRDEIAKSGVWCKGDYVHADGASISRCAVGAIQAATRTTLVERWTEGGTHGYGVGYKSSTNLSAENAAIEALAMAVDPAANGRNWEEEFENHSDSVEEIVTSWNDDEDRRAEEVLALFDVAIANVVAGTQLTFDDLVTA